MAIARGIAICSVPLAIVSVDALIYQDPGVHDLLEELAPRQLPESSVDHESVEKLDIDPRTINSRLDPRSASRSIVASRCSRPRISALPPGIGLITVSAESRSGSAKITFHLADQKTKDSSARTGSALGSASPASSSPAHITVPVSRFGSSKRIKRLSVVRRTNLFEIASLCLGGCAREPFNPDSGVHGSARSIREFRSPRRRVPRVRLASACRPRFARLGNSTVRDPMEYPSLSLPRTPLPRASLFFPGGKRERVPRLAPDVHVISGNNALPSMACGPGVPEKTRPRDSPFARRRPSPSGNTLRGADSYDDLAFMRRPGLRFTL